MPRAEWERARDGWMGRMHDPSDMGHTTARFNQLYHEARARAVVATQPFAVVARPAGSHVEVQWSDGNRYPATVVQAQDGHTLVTFADSRQQWVPDSSLGPR